MLKCDVIQLLLRHEICPGWSHFLSVRRSCIIWPCCSKISFSARSNQDCHEFRISLLLDSGTWGPLPMQDTSGLDQETGRMGYARSADETKKVLTSSALLNTPKTKSVHWLCVKVSSYIHISVSAMYIYIFFLKKTQFDKILQPHHLSLHLFFL